MISHRRKGKLVFTVCIAVSQAQCQKLHIMLFHLLGELIRKLRPREVNNCCNHTSRKWGVGLSDSPVWFWSFLLGLPIAAAPDEKFLLGRMAPCAPVS